MQITAGNGNSVCLRLCFCDGEQRLLLVFALNRIGQSALL